MGLMMLKLFDDSEERKAMRVLALALAVLGMALLLFGAIIMALGYSSSNERAVWVGWCVFLSAGVPSVLVHRWFRT